MHSLLLGLLLATACTAANTGRSGTGGAGPSASADTGQPARPPSSAREAADGGQPPDAGLAWPEPAGPARRLYMLGTSVNLRGAPSAQAEVVDKVPIGTECTTSAPAGGEWLPVDCAGKRGFVSASLTSPEPPPLEQYRFEAREPQRPLAQRLEFALRAATLEPWNGQTRQLLGEVFYQRQLELAAADKPPKKKTFTRRCHLEAEISCIKMDIAGLLRGIGVDGASTGQRFVVAFGNPEQVKVIRGTYTTRPVPDRPETYTLTYTVLAEESFTPTEVLQKALFLLCGTPDESCSKLPGAAPMGQFVLDEASQALLSAIPREWGWLELVPDARLTLGLNKGPWFDLLWNCPEKKPLLLTLAGDVHGRWKLSFPLGDWAWISAVEKTGEGLMLTLVSENLYPKREVTTKQVLFKLPAEGKDIAYLGAVPYSANIRRYQGSTKHYYTCD